MEDALYRTYHDEEWGVPEYDDGNSSRNLCWMASKPDSPGVPFYTKENPSAVFDKFSPEKIADYGEADVKRLLQDRSIVRSESKIRATMSNARCYLKIMETGKGAFSNYLWGFVNGNPMSNQSNVTRNTRCSQPKANPSPKI